MQSLKHNKIVMGGVVVALAALVYFWFFSGDSSKDALVTTNQDPTSEVSRSLLVTLSNLNTIKLDNTIFDDPVFLSLSDFGVVIPLEPVGRRNPFAPL